MDAKDAKKSMKNAKDAKKNIRAEGKREDKGARILQRPPRTAVVTLTAASDAKLTYAQAMAAARERISLAEMDIDGVRPKTSKTGGLILEIRGPGSQEKAQKLADRMAGVLEGSGVRVARPTKTGELRIRGLDVSSRPQEVAAAVAAVGDCSVANVRVGDIAFTPLGRGAVWVRCPLDAAHRVAKAGRITVGWCSAAVEPLQTRPLQCFRCLEVGHTRSGCTSGTDRSGLCYRCGGSGHRASKCSAAPRCPLCSDLGRPAGHRLGAPSCAPCKPGGRRGRREPDSSPRPALPAATTPSAPTPSAPTTPPAPASPAPAPAAMELEVAQRDTTTEQVEARVSALELSPAQEPAERSPDLMVGQCPTEEGMDLE